MSVKYVVWVLFGVVAIAFVSYASFHLLPGRSVVWGDDPDTPFAGDFSFLQDAFNQLGEVQELTVAILGVAGEGYRSGTLADAIVVVHLDPVQEKIFLISVPRDLWISDAQEEFKLNELLSRNKVTTGLSVVESFTGLSLDGYAVVDLHTIEALVDDVGGVEVTLEEPARDWVSGYELSAGSHLLSGDDVVWLLRNRYNREGDFFREANQHRVVSALWDTLLHLSSDQLLDLAKAYVLGTDALSNIHIDLTMLTPLLLNEQVKNFSLESIVVGTSTQLVKLGSVSHPESGALVSVVLPTAGFGNYADIRAYVQKIISEGESIE